MLRLPYHVDDPAKGKRSAACKPTMHEPKKEVEGNARFGSNVKVSVGVKAILDGIKVSKNISMFVVILTDLTSR